MQTRDGPSQQRLPPVTYQSVEKLLQVPFRVLEQRRLAVCVRTRGHQVVGNPIEAFERLCLIDQSRTTIDQRGRQDARDRVIEVQRLSDLVGRVSLDSPNSALAFVRLRTSPATFFLLDEGDRASKAEVINRDLVDDAAFEYRNAARPYPWHREGNGFHGVISSTLSAQLGIGNTRCVALGAGRGADRGTSPGAAFQVDRTLLVERIGRRLERQLALQRVTERVWRDGRLETTRVMPLPPRLLEAAYWSVLTFE